MALAIDQAIQQASQAIDVSGIGKSTSDALNMGMSLAQRQAEVEKNKQELAFKAQQLDLQKHDYFHDKLNQVINEDDPKLRGALVDSLNDEYTQMFGQRMNPAFPELMKKSQPVLDKLRALYNVRQAFRTHKPDQISQFDNQVTEGMSSKNFSDSWKQLNDIDQNQNGILKALTAQGVNPLTAGPALQEGNQNALQEAMNLAPRARMAATNRSRLAMSLDNQAASAGERFEKDTPLNKLYQQTQGLDRANHTLQNQDTTLTPQIFREVEQEFSQALSGPGNASLGKLERTEMQSIAIKADDFWQKYKNQPVDVRKNAPQLVQQLQASIDRLHGAYSSNMEDRAQVIGQNFDASDNPKVHAVLQEKYSKYAPRYYEQKYGESTGANQAAASAKAAGSPSGQVAPTPAPNAPGGAANDTTQNPNPEPKVMQDQRALLRSQAVAKLSQIRNSKPGTLTTTEKDVRDKYKLLTGEDLVE